MRIDSSISDNSSSTSMSAESHRQPSPSDSFKYSLRSFSSRLRRILKGPPELKESHTSQKRKEPSEPYTHIPTAASSAFLKTTTTTDMFELTGTGRLAMCRSMNDLQNTRRVVARRASESRLKHIEAAERDLSRGERGDV